MPRIALVLVLLAVSSCSTTYRARRLRVKCERTCSAAGLEVKEIELSRRACVCSQS